MTFEQAVIEIMRAYWEGDESELSGLTSKPKKYTKEYFNSFSNKEMKEPEEIKKETLKK